MAIQKAHEMFPGLPLLAGGKSFGGRMTSQALSKASEPGLKGIVFVGFPLHAAGNPGTERAAHLAKVTLPMLFLQGTRDALADIDLMQKICKHHALATLKKFDGADHSFKAGKQDLVPSLAEAIRDWCKTIKT
jgi:predicted alpha/beta-hydrolase family hydrolase